MLVTEVRTDGTISLGEDARRLGYLPGALVRVIRTSADTLIVALHDEPVTVEAPARRLPAARARRAIGRVR